MPEIPYSWLEGQPDCYTSADLQALSDADLNALAAELRGATCHLCEIGHRLSNDGQLHLPSQSIGMIEVQPCKMAQFTPATNRNQSGELLQWAWRTHGILFYIGFTGGASPGYVQFETPVIRRTVHSHTARAETEAFVAAMLAMEGRLANGTH